MQTELELQLKGLSVTRVWVESEAFLQWCRKHRRPPTRGSRSQFVLVAAEVQSGADG